MLKSPEGIPCQDDGLGQQPVGDHPHGRSVLAPRFSLLGFCSAQLGASQQQGWHGSKTTPNLPLKSTEIPSIAYRDEHLIKITAQSHPPPDSELSTVPFVPNTRTERII